MWTHGKDKKKGLGFAGPFYSPAFGMANSKMQAITTPRRVIPMISMLQYTPKPEYSPLVGG